MFKPRWRRREIDLAVFLKYGRGMKGRGVAQIGPEPREGSSRRNSIDKLLAGFSEQQDNIIGN